jgi:hypothetical protein
MRLALYDGSLAFCPQITRIKERVEEKEGIPPSQQRLIFGGKQMHDEKIAKDFGVEGGSVLHVSQAKNRFERGFYAI